MSLPLLQAKGWGVGGRSGALGARVGLKQADRPGAGPAARARVLLALGNAVVVWISSPSIPIHHTSIGLAAAYSVILLIILYSLAVWRLEAAPRPPRWLPRWTAWLDVLCGTVLIAVTGAHRSPFFMWNVFTVVSTALDNGWGTAVRVCIVQTALYFAICLPHMAHPDFHPAVFLVRTAYLLVIALVLAHMGQRLLEQNRVLTRLHRAAAHMSCGRSPSEILARFADSLTDMLEVDQVAAGWPEGGNGSRPALVNLDQEQGEYLLTLAQELLAGDIPSATTSTRTAGTEARSGQWAGGLEAPGARRHLLVTRLPESTDGPGALVACSRAGASFLRSDRELAELLAAHAGPLLETARLQEQRRYHAGVDERRRIAGELHDRLIQTLASLDLRALTCGDLCRERRWEPLGQEVGQLKRLAEEAIEEARGVVSELAPVRLREAGLTFYLEDCLHQFQERTPIMVEAAFDLQDREVPEPAALLVIGLLREGLNNIRKHAQASRVTLRVAQRGDAIELRLTDDGAGFCPEQIPLRQSPTRQYGLAYLRERVGGMGGELHVISRPGEGTTLEARVPLLTEDRLVSRFAAATAATGR